MLRVLYLYTSLFLSLVASSPCESATSPIPKFLFDIEKGVLLAVDVAVSEEGRLAVSDPTKGLVSIYDSCGNFLFDLEEFPSAQRVVFNSDGQIIVTRSGTLEVRVYDQEGKIIYGFTGPESSTDRIIGGLSVDEMGNIAISIRSSPSPPKSEIYVFDSCGNFLFNFGDFSTGLSGHAIDSQGNFFVLDATELHVFSPKGEPLFQKTLLGLTASNFNQIAINEAGLIFVSEDPNNKIFIYDKCCNFLTSIDGSDTPFLNFNPEGIAISKDNILFVADKGRVDAFRIQ